MKTIYLLTTGGTIEKVYSEETGSVTNAESKIDRYLKLLRLPDAEINIVPLLNKESLEMTDEDRLLLLGMMRAILKEKVPIVITHGHRHADLSVPIVVHEAIASDCTVKRRSAVRLALSVKAGRGGQRS